MKHWTRFLEAGRRIRDRAGCVLLGHRTVRHITEARVRHADVVWGVSYDAVRWDFRCSRCHTSFGSTPPPTRKRFRP